MISVFPRLWRHSGVRACLRSYFYSPFLKLLTALRSAPRLLTDSQDSVWRGRGISASSPSPTGGSGDTSIQWWRHNLAPTDIIPGMRSAPTPGPPRPGAPPSPTPRGRSSPTSRSWSEWRRHSDMYNDEGGEIVIWKETHHARWRLALTPRTRPSASLRGARLPTDSVSFHSPMTVY